MPVFVGTGSDDFEAKSDRVGVPIETSDPNPASVGDMYFNNPSGKLRVYDGTSWDDVGASDISGNVSGGTPYTPAAGDGIYKFNVFTNPGTLTVSNSDVVVEAIIVGGGGGGAVAGGGAGGVVARTYTLSPGSYPITIGTGGGVGPNLNTAGCPGGNTTFNGCTAYGGGGGGANTSPYDGLPGGSGGGAGSGGTGGTACPGQGNDGGTHGCPTSSAGTSGGGFNNPGCPHFPTRCSEPGGFAGSVMWCLPPSVAGTCSTGATVISGGGGGYNGAFVQGCPGGGIYGRGGPAAYGFPTPSPAGQPGCPGALFIRYKILQ